MQVVLTNIAGPSQLGTSIGRRIYQAVAWMPIIGDTPLSIAMISFGDTLSLTLTADEALGREDRLLDVIAELIYAEIEDLRELVKIAAEQKRKTIAS